MVNIWMDRRKNFKESYAFELSRLFSYPFTVFFNRLGFVSPNFITFLTLIFSIVASILLFNGYFLIAGLIYWFSWVFDLVDGEIARLRIIKSEIKVYTKFGMWFDGIIDRIRELIILFSVSIVLYLQNPSVLVLVISILAIVGGLFWRHSALYMKSIFSIEESKQKDMKMFGFDVALQNLIITVLIMANQLYTLLLVFAILFNLAWIKNLILWSIKYKNE
ncbi:CDP-alcohol phosphatidyltransferase family protein [Candidatus Woesearchaeota archaeon]|jgi:phosphatidylglycerophosphate synthase|nr:CDP-alcohol phosphatidyltransferase family protein [Candidatus Woesearchaeota archaeon]